MLWLASGKAAYAGLQLVVLAVLARLVSPADFGVVSAALVVIGFSAIVSQLGLGPALVQRPDLEPRHVDTAFTASVLFGLALGGVLWAVAPAVAGFFRTPGVAPVMRALAWVFPLQGLGTTAESLARRDLQFRWLALLDAKAYGLGYGVVGVGLALPGWGVWAPVAGEVAEAAHRALPRGAPRAARLPPPAHGLPPRDRPGRGRRAAGDGRVVPARARVRPRGARTPLDGRGAAVPDPRRRHGAPHHQQAGRLARPGDGSGVPPRLAPGGLRRPGHLRLPDRPALGQTAWRQARRYTAPVARTS